MFRTYLSLVVLVCLAAVAGCGDDETSGGGVGGGGTGGTGTGGTGGTGTGGTGGTVLPGDQKTITLGCTNNVTTDTSILPFELAVDTDGITGGAAFEATFNAVAQFSEVFLDAAQGAVPGGVTKASLVELNATVHVRSGASGDDVVMQLEDIPYTCTLEDAGMSVPCDPANDQASIPGRQPNSDCVPTGFFNPCAQFVTIPTSDDCSPTGECVSLGKSTDGTDGQCMNGFCVTGGLPLPLQEATGTYTADASGSVLFGWDDAGTGATVNADGTYDLPAAVFTEPAGPNGLRVSAGGVAVALECTMAVDSAGEGGVATCSGGDNDGDPCTAPADGGNEECFGGLDDGAECENNSDCADGETLQCVGGPNDGMSCTMDMDCANGGAGGGGGAGGVGGGGGEDGVCLSTDPGVCANVDCGPGASCGPQDEASPSPDAVLISIDIQ